MVTWWWSAPYWLLYKQRLKAINSLCAGLIGDELHLFNYCFHFLSLTSDCANPHYIKWLFERHLCTFVPHQDNREEKFKIIVQDSSPFEVC